MNIFIDPILFLQSLREMTGGIFDTFFLSCSFYGEISTVIVLIAIIYWCLDKKFGEFLFLSLVLGLFVNSLTKITACIYRPWILDSRVQPLEEALGPATGYSFPSGHTTITTVLFGGAILRKNYSKALNIVFLFCIFLIAFSRLYVGVHNVIDVIAGFLFTFIVLIIVNRLYDKLEEKPNLDSIIAAFGILFTVLLMFYASTKSYPMDYDTLGKLVVDPAIAILDVFTLSGFIIGFFISWIGERKLINFSIDGSVETKILRLFCGLIILGFLIRVLLPLAGHDYTGRFLAGFIIMSFAVFIYPVVIKFFQNRKTCEN